MLRYARNGKDIRFYFTIFYTGLQFIFRTAVSKFATAPKCISGNAEKTTFPDVIILNMPFLSAATAATAGETASAMAASAAKTTEAAAVAASETAG